MTIPVNDPTLENLQQQNKKLTQQNAELSAKLQWYEEQFRLAQHRRFGASSEKTFPEQLELNLFNEAEVLASPEPEVETEQIAYERRKQRGKREADLSKLPVETRVYELPTAEQVCTCCGGALHGMSTETRQEIAVVPAQVKVIRHVRQIYACRTCEREGERTPIVSAPMPRPVYPGSLVSPSLLAHILYQKYVNGLPLYRQEQDFTRMGFPLSRQSMANWMIYASEQWLSPLFHVLKQYALQQDILHADETTLQVLREPGKSAESKSYVWLYRTGSSGPPVVLYEYQPSRGGEHPRNFLAGFEGILQVDGYAGYHKVKGVRLAGCWAHARRGFDEALKALPPSQPKVDTAAQEGLTFCNRLYAVERETKELPAEEREQVRMERSRPILEAFSGWLRQQKGKTLPKSKLGEAIGYCLNQWDKLTLFLEDGRIELDNNRAERSIKPFVIGRKNWLFANTPRGAQASAVIYSVMETAKENGLHPFRYLTFLFEQLPQLENVNDPQALEPFLPWSTDLPPDCRVLTS
jgi:transposase